LFHHDDLFHDLGLGIGLGSCSGLISHAGLLLLFTCSKRECSSSDQHGGAVQAAVQNASLHHGHINLPWIGRIGRVIRYWSGFMARHGRDCGDWAAQRLITVAFSTI
jgi:hypothetical protein